MPVPLVQVLGATSLSSFGLSVGVLSSGSLDLGGIAAVIAALAGLVSAIGAIVIGLRSKQNTEDDLEKELLMRLLKEQLEKDEP